MFSLIDNIHLPSLETNYFDDETRLDQTVQVLGEISNNLQNKILWMPSLGFIKALQFYSMYIYISDEYLIVEEDEEK